MKKDRIINLPNNCYECKLFVAIEGATPGYAGIIPKSCALMDVMPNVRGIALDRPEFCPLEKCEVNFKLNFEK